MQKTVTNAYLLKYFLTAFVGLYSWTSSINLFDGYTGTPPIVVCAFLPIIHAKGQPSKAPTANH